jgi:hypothetical protein
MTQSAEDAQVVLHVVASAQIRKPGHGIPVPMQEPVPSQVPAVRKALLHELHALVGPTQLPNVSQSFTAHGPPIGVQANEQQWVPVPLTPQVPLEHWLFAVHIAPGWPLLAHWPAGPGFWQ